MEAGIGEEDRLFELGPGEVTAAERLEEGSSPRQEQGRGGWSADGAGANHLTWSSRTAEEKGEEESRCC